MGNEGKRITFVIAADVLKKCRERQAASIKVETVSVSFSRILNEILRKGLAK